MLLPLITFRKQFHEYTFHLNEANFFNIHQRITRTLFLCACFIAQFRPTTNIFFSLGHRRSHFSILLASTALACRATLSPVGLRRDQHFFSVDIRRKTFLAPNFLKYHRRANMPKDLVFIMLLLECNQNKLNVSKVAVSE